jgi:hypothetical protein
MLIFRTLSGIAAAALGAAIVLALPGFSPQVEAGTPPPVVKSNRLDFRLIGPACTRQAWPYYEAHCLRDRTNPAGKPHVVRIVTIDRIVVR